MTEAVTEPLTAAGLAETRRPEPQPEPPLP